MQESISAKNLPKPLRKPVSNDKNNYIGKKSLPSSVEVYRMKRLSIMLIALLTLSMFSMMIITVPEEAEASPLTIVLLSLQAEPPKVDVSPGSAGIITMLGSVTCTKYGPDPVKVFLTGSSDFGPAPVVPSSFVFGGSAGTESSATFSVTTRVPVGTTFTLTPAVTVQGRYDQGGLTGTISAVNQIIQIEPYYKLEVDTPPPQEIGAGEFVYFAIKITNVGNTEDTYEFIFQNLEKLQEIGWIVATITPKTFQEDDVKTITVSAQAPQTWSLWRNEVTPFNLRILSQQSVEEGGNVRYDVPLYVRQKGIYIPGFSPIFLIAGLGAVALAMGKRRLDT
jgi:hypothetical protein